MYDSDVFPRVSLDAATFGALDTEGGITPRLEPDIIAGDTVTPDMTFLRYGA